MNSTINKPENNEAGIPTILLSRPNDAQSGDDGSSVSTFDSESSSSESGSESASISESGDVSGVTSIGIGKSFFFEEADRGDQKEVIVRQFKFLTNI